MDNTEDAKRIAAIMLMSDHDQITKDRADNVISQLEKLCYLKQVDFIRVKIYLYSLVKNEQRGEKLKKKITL
jgi:hypothetical protein